ncbi:MAG: molybdenum cofactor biosynthesis protein MoaE [Bacteroidia bacterium]|nr:molybdenum cofactor biosynthesis protein MoaE [Bacteroidia bacterium]MBT8309060.1 molybdenum cofactor biosynthesis protein MoaE [Bacteroidia bacterium]NND11968.1 molybdenum cofactor biosynthesis protein MoaE [Flavobacteriaceae bacterium]NNK26968.1 molybdenum cofactor biosynthesis protein MoaE [Flavobacteriaceae bacterium]NNL61061.1 molybdenum cofactor biosynthesis protein MoaE [Flavobacteriaceae bacterium]
MKNKKIKNIFIEGGIPPEKIAQSISNHKSKTGIGAHDIFLGQVRADKIGNKMVGAIEFSAQEEMANEVCHEIREAVFDKFPVNCLHIYHSLGKVVVGEICFFVFVSSGHRDEVFESMPFLVNEIKAKVPIFGKEIFEDETHQWKINK